MNVVNILILECNNELTIELINVLQLAGFQKTIHANSVEDLDALLQREEVSFAVIGLSFIAENGKKSVFETLERSDIPFICLFPTNNFVAEDRLSTSQPYALLGKQFNVDALKVTIENQLFYKKKSEYIELRKRLLMDDHIFVKIGSQLEKINTSKILYIASDGNYSMVQTENRKYAVKMSLKKMLEDLPENSFARIHRGYLVQLKQISKVNIADNQVFIGEEILPLGRYYKSDVLSRLNRVG